jgi:hypothetical protein
MFKSCNARPTSWPLIPLALAIAEKQIEIVLEIG